VLRAGGGGVDDFVYHADGRGAVHAAGGAFVLRDQAGVRGFALTVGGGGEFVAVQHADRGLGAADAARPAATQ